METTNRKRLPFGQRVGELKFLIFGLVEAIAKTGIKVREINQRKTLWLEAREGIDISLFKKGDHLECYVAVRTFKGQDGAIKTKLYIEEVNTLNKEDDRIFRWIQLPAATVEIVGSVKCSFSSLWLLTLKIGNSSLFARWYNKPEEDKQPELGSFRVDFDITNTDWIVTPEGEIFVDEYVDSNSGETKHKYYPALFVTKIY